MADQPIVIDPTGTDIHGEAARIRAQGPVAKIELPGGVLAWSIAGYEVAQQALADNRLSKDPKKHWIDYLDGKIGADFPLIGWVLMENLTTAHGSDHTRLRKPCANAFTPRRVERLRPSVEKVTSDLLDELAELPPGEAVDIKASFAHALPAQVICDLFGVPEESRAEMLHGHEVNVDTTISPEESAANVARWHQLMLDFIAEKRRNPADDLTTDLIAAQDDGGRLTDDEMVGTLHIMLATGTEPVKNLIANTVFALLTHPEQLALIKSGQATWEDAIEETLRVQAPVAQLPFRFAVEDIELGGVTIRKGDPVLMHYAAIGRDTDVHGETTAEFDITRQNKEHLSFGAGIYRCIGKPLALQEARIAVRALFERFPDLTLAVEPQDVEPYGTFIMNSIGTLPVYLKSSGPAGA